MQNLVLKKTGCLSQSFLVAQGIKSEHPFPDTSRAVCSLPISIVFVIISVNTQHLNCLRTPIAFLNNLCYNEIVKKATPDPKVMRDSGVLYIRRLVYDPDPARGLFVAPN